MSIRYTISSNPLRPGQFYPRPVTDNTRDLKVLIRNIESKTTLAAPDIQAVVAALIEEVTDGLVDGDRVSIDGLVDFSTRMSQVVDSAADSFDPDSGGVLLLTASAKKTLTDTVRAQARYEKLVAPVKLPAVVAFLDIASGQSEQFTPGSIGQINGENLKILTPLAPDEGIFFVSENDGQDTKVTILQNNGDRELVFEIPSGLVGEQNLQVRTRYTRDGSLRIGSFNQSLAQAA